MILLDTHAWVRWLHPEISRKLPDRLRTWLEAADAQNRHHHYSPLTFIVSSRTVRPPYAPTRPLVARPPSPPSLSRLRYVPRKPRLVIRGCSQKKTQRLVDCGGIRKSRGHVRVQNNTMTREMFTCGAKFPHAQTRQVILRKEFILLGNINFRNYSGLPASSRKFRLNTRCESR